MHHRSGPWYFGRVPLTLTFQMEVARRLIGLIDSDDCSRISIMSNFITEPKLLFKIPGIFINFRYIVYLIYINI